MAKIGYLQLTKQIGEHEESRKWMENYGCATIVEERVSDEKQRPAWKQLMKQLVRGDEIIIAKFSNALRGLSELSLFLEYCRREMIRVISVGDRIDSQGMLFLTPSTSDFLNLIAGMPAEISMMRKANSLECRLRKIRKLRPINKMTKQERNKKIIKLYIAGYPIDEIWKVSGFKSRSSVFRVLADNNIEFNRGHSKRQLEEKKANDQE